MKTLKTIAMVLIAVAMGTAGCKKDKSATENVPGIPTVKGCLVSKITSNTDYETNQYDDKGRIVKASYFDTDGEEKGYSQYVYKNAEIEEQYFYNGVLKDKTLYSLDNKGYIVKEVSTSNWESGAFTYTKTYTDVYEHNADGFLTKNISTSNTVTNDPQYNKSSDYNYVGTFIYADGNLVKSEDNYGSDKSVTVYEYYTDKPNNVVNSDNPLAYLFGKPSKNLLKSSVNTEQESSSSSHEVKSAYTYVFDADGKVTKSVEVFKTDSDSEHVYQTAFEYLCK